MSLWCEVWQRPGHASFGRVIDSVPSPFFTLHDGVNLVGDGSMQIANTFDRFADILAVDTAIPSNTVNSLIRVFSDADPTMPMFEWLPRMMLPTTSKQDPNVDVSGLGIKSIWGYARVEAYDWDGSSDWVPAQPDWIYGGLNILTNPGFEIQGIENGDFELGTIAYWSVSPGFNAIASVAAACSGTYGGELDPGSAGTGWSRSVGNLIPGDTYTITGKLREPTAAGLNYRAGVNGVTSASHTNAYEDGGYYWAELDNAAQGSGATDGTCQDFTLTFVATSTNVGLVIEYNDAGNGILFYIDDWTITGNGAGLAPWERFEAFGAKVVIFERSTTQAHSGTASLRVQVTEGFDDRGGGISQTIDTALGQTITFEAWVFQASGVSQEFLAILRRGGGGIDTGQGVSYVASSQTTVPTGTWTRIVVTGVTDFVETMVQVRLIGTVGMTGPVYFVDDAAAWVGLPATTIGDILTQLYDDATSDHSAVRLVWEDDANPGSPYLTLDFDATVDSAGVPWFHPELTIKLWMRMTYLQVMEQFVNTWGYEWRIVPNNVEAGTWLLQVYNPGGMKADYTAAAAPAIQGGSSDVRRSINEVLPEASDFMVEGEGRITTRVRESGLDTAIGLIETSRLDRELPSQDAVTDAAFEDATESTVQGLFFQYELVDPQSVPLVNYQLGDELHVHDPPLVDLDCRVVDVECVRTPTAETYEAQFAPSTPEGS